MTSQTPVALFVFNRSQDLQRTLDCLKNNGVQNLWVFADGPRSGEEKGLTDQVREIIEAIDWVVPKKHYQKKNIGLSQSIRHGLDSVFKIHDRVIVIEDDICVSPGFYDYMEKCLDTYKERADILGVTGLRYPFSRKNLDKTGADVFLAPRFSSWGWGTWKEKWERIDFDLSRLEKKFQNNSAIDLSIAGDDAATSIGLLRAGNLSGCWDVFVLMNMLINNQAFVWPKYNMVENTGLLEGTHASAEEAPPKLCWEGPVEKKIITPVEIRKNDKIIGDFVAYFYITQGSMRKGRRMLKKLVKKTMNSAGLDVVKLKKKTSSDTTNPEDYSTTDEPMEVPCQKESYFLALNKYIKEGDRVLDVGMGIGYGMNLLSIKATEVYAVDVDEKAVQACTENVLGKNPKVKELKKYDGYKLPYKDDFFDVVTCIDVVEHVEDYDRFIDELMRVAKRSVVFATPNRRPEYTNPDGSPMNYWHLREWSFDEFDEIVRAHAKKVDWNVLDGPWEGPFKIGSKATSATLVLLPALIKGKS